MGNPKYGLRRRDIESFPLLFFFYSIAEGVARQIGLFHPDLGLELNGSWPVLWPLGQPPVATRIIKVLFLHNINELISFSSRLYTYVRSESDSFYL